MQIPKFFFSMFFSLLMGCSKAPALPAAPLIWDLSQDNIVSRVGWPENNHDDWLIVDSNRVQLKLRTNETVLVHFLSATIGRKGNRITGISFILFPGDLETTYNTAMALCDQWKLEERTEIEKWYATEGRDILRGHSAVRAAAISDESAIQGRSVQVCQSFAPGDKPWTVKLGFGFVQNYDNSPMLPGPATMKSTHTP